MRDHVFVISYNRPELLRRTLSALAAQTDRRWQITLCQDGPIDPRDSREKAAIGECTEIFRGIFPGEEVAESRHNLGIGLHVLAAQRRAFVDRRLDVAFFFEDDLIPHATYMEQMLVLRTALSRHRHICPYFACYGATHAFSPMAEQISGSMLRFMDHFWGYGLFREHWEEEQQVLQPYYDYLSTVSYRDRDNGFVREMFLAMGHPRFATSQDSARTVALLRLGRCGVTTIPRRATYVGREGTHCTGPAYATWKFNLDALPEHLEVIVPRVSPRALAEGCSTFPRWVRAIQEMPPNQLDWIYEREAGIGGKAEMEAEIAGKDSLIRQMTTEAANLREELRAIRGSTLWRATAPLRLALDKVRAPFTRFLPTTKG